MPAAALLLLKLVDGRWVPDGPAIRYEDDLAHTGRWKADRYGQQWVEKDPEKRRHRVEDTL